MDRNILIDDLVKLGDILLTVSNDDASSEASNAHNELTQSWPAAIRQSISLNPWFTHSNVIFAIKAWAKSLNKENLTNWLLPYSFTSQPKTIALVMAGNIPLVGLHDLLSVLVSGHKALVKTSSDDTVLMQQIINTLFQINPDLRNYIRVSEGPLKNFDAVIATGSDNTARYFNAYFGAYPHIIRKNRTSLAIISGKESKEELKKLGRDIFTHFGMGCRNVSHLLVPEGYIFDDFFEAIYSFGEVVNHNKYANNYDYHKAIFLLEQLPFLDNNFLMIRENKSLFSPLSVLHYSYYRSSNEVMDYILDHHQEIQCIVGDAYLPFGKAQEPNLSDYADNVDTLEFLTNL